MSLQYKTGPRAGQQLADRITDLLTSSSWHSPEGAGHHSHRCRKCGVHVAYHVKPLTAGRRTIRRLAERYEP